ncbi:MAG: hypothetical protein ACOX6N_01000 [Patescibacteria group bacterium]|jgi:hypothetical protein
MIRRLWLLWAIILVLIVGLVSCFFIWRKNTRENNFTNNNSDVATIGSTEDPFKPSEVRFEEIVAPPVKRDYVDGYGVDADIRRLSLTLPIGEEVYTIFEGEIAWVSKDEESTSILVKNSEGWMASYIVVGESLVEVGQKVGTTDVIARIDEGVGISCVGGNNFSISISNESGDVIFNKNIFK